MCVCCCRRPRHDRIQQTRLLPKNQNDRIPALSIMQQQHLGSSLVLLEPQDRPHTASLPPRGTSACSPAKCSSLLGTILQQQQQSKRESTSRDDGVVLLSGRTSSCTPVLRSLAMEWAMAMTRTKSVQWLVVGHRSSCYDFPPYSTTTMLQQSTTHHNNNTNHHHALQSITVHHFPTPAHVCEWICCQQQQPESDDHNEGGVAWIVDAVHQLSVVEDPSSADTTTTPPTIDDQLLYALLVDAAVDCHAQLLLVVVGDAGGSAAIHQQHTSFWHPCGHSIHVQPQPQRNHDTATTTTASFVRGEFVDESQHNDATTMLFEVVHQYPDGAGEGTTTTRRALLGTVHVLDETTMEWTTSTVQQ